MDVDAAVRPRFKSCVQPIISSDDGLFLLSEGRHAWIPDPIYAALAPMLDGAHEVEAIFEALSDTYPVEQVFAALDRLRTSGYLAEDAAVEARPTMAFWEHVGVPPSLARSRLDVTLVSTVALGDVDLGSAHRFARAPRGQGRARGRRHCRRYRRLSATAACGVEYPVTDLRKGLASGEARGDGDLDRTNVRTGTDRVLGVSRAAAPRASQARRIHRTAQWHGRPGRVPFPPCIASTRHAALAEAATEITRWIGTGGQSTLLDRVVSTSVLTLERTHHDLTRRPQCPSCGSPEPDNGRRPQAGAPPSTPKGPYVGRRASRPRPTGGARAT